MYFSRKKIANYIFRSSNDHDYCLTGKKPAKIQLNVRRLIMTKSWKFRRPVMKKLISVLAKKFTGKKNFWNWIEKIETEKQVNLITSVFFSYSLKYRRWCKEHDGFSENREKANILLLCWAQSFQFLHES